MSIFSISFTAASSQYLAIAQPFAYQSAVSYNFSCVGWVKLTNNGTNQVLFDNRFGGAGGGFAVYIDPSGNANVYVFGPGTNVVSTGVNLYDGSWHHIVATYDGTTLKLYVDGILNPSPGTTTLFVPNNLSNLLAAFGIAFDGTVPINGKLTYLSLYSTALTSGNISGLSAGSIDPATLSPIGDWKFPEGGTSPTTADSSGAGNLATLTNGPTWDNDIPSQLGGSGVSTFIPLSFPNLPKSFLAM